MTTIDRTGVPQLPVLDRRALEDLGAELSNRAGALQFAGKFAEMLPRRIVAVEAALTVRDAEAAVVALLSLNVSASMVGACRLEEASSAALGSVGDPAAHGPIVTRLRAHAVDFQSALGGTIR